MLSVTVSVGSVGAVAGHVGLGPHLHEIDAELGADDEQRRGGVAHLAEKRQLAAAQVGAELLLHGEDVGERLGGMELGRKPVPHRHAGIGGQVLHHRLLEAAVLDAVVHAAEHAGGVLDGLLLAHLRAAGIQVGHAHAQVHGAHLEGAAGTGRGLLEQKHDILALQVAVGHAGALHVLEVAGQIEQVADLLGSEIEQSEEVLSRKIERHGITFSQIVGVA